MTEQPTLHLELSIEDVNLILEALGEQPFKSVYGLVSRLQNQARGQLQSAPESEVEAPARQEAS
ncbi:MAG: hypothetical protein ACK46L_05800 [Synechococcaceae cyanobacterium]|jgi:hypothetical protein